MKATDLLKKHHKELRSFFREVQKVDGNARRKVMEQIGDRLEAHMAIEEAIFYPAVREIGTKKVEEMIPEAFEEHHVVSLVIAELPEVDPQDERFAAKMTVLEELVEHHVREEEKEMFKVAEKLGSERLSELGEQMERRMNELLNGKAQGAGA